MPIVADVSTRCRRRSRARRSPADASSSRRRTSTRPRVQRGDRGAARARRSRPALMKSRSGPPINPPHTVATRRRCRSPATAHDARRSARAARAARRRCVPATVGAVAGRRRRAVTGETAGDADFNATMHAPLPVVFAFVLGLAFLLLLVTFRSIVIPLTAIALNLLSVGAAYGVLVWIFQDGHLQGLLGFHSNGGDRHLAAAVPVRDPVRALDGLPRVHRQPDQGARRPRHVDGGGRRARASARRRAR